VDARELLASDREHAERVVRAQILFGGKREARQIRVRLEICGVNAGALAAGAVRGDVLVGVLHRPLQPRELQRAQLVLARALDGLELAVAPLA
jgi:hypothetical protein